MSHQAVSGYTPKYKMANSSSNKRFEVFETENSGRGVQAVNSLHPGDAVIVEQPSVFVLSNSVRGVRCDFCFAAKEDLQRCSKCKFSRYCGRDCQKKAWQEHKTECKRLVNVSPRVPTDTVLLIARVLNAKSGDDTITWFDSLVCHMNDFEDRRREEFSSILFVLQQFLGEEVAEQFSPAEIFEIFGRISCNSFTICDAEMHPLGIGLYQSASRLNHSCRPNCLAVFDGPKLMIRAIEKVQPNEELTIGYIELLAPSVKRREELRKQYFFECSCVRCSCAEDEDGLLLSTTCSNSDCNGMVLCSQESWICPRIHLNFNAHLLTTATDEPFCQTCCTKVSATTLTSMDFVQTNTAEVLTEIKTLQSTGSTQDALELCETTLDKQRGILHHYHYLVANCVDMAMDCCISLQLWDKALDYGLQSLEVYRKFYQQYHPSIGIQLFRIGKLQLYLGYIHKGVQSLEQARAILEVTHGNKHPLLDQLKEQLAEGTEELKRGRRGDTVRSALTLVDEK